jgi:hypothetical protein
MQPDWGLSDKLILLLFVFNIDFKISPVGRHHRKLITSFILWVAGVPFYPNELRSELVVKRDIAAPQVGVPSRANTRRNRLSFA